MQFNRKLGAMWGLVGVSLIIGSAIARVLPKAIDTFQYHLNLIQWLVLIIWVSFMVVCEGYRGFQKQFSPRVAARFWHLIQKGETIDLWLAPLFCMGYFHATKRRVISSWLLTFGVTIIILVVIQLAQPWRGIIDCGVVLGLSYGLVFIYIFSYQTIRRRECLVDPEINSSRDY